jgi:serine phosphatase RsbU (regulator of sigma subunit)
MQKELEIAATIQTALLPRTEAINGAHYDLFAFMGPAEDVGGDYYDVIEGADGRLWVGIGDVSGHGLTAGLTMMMTQAAAATYVRACPEIGPRQLLAGVNGTLCENVRRFGTDDFFTACFLALEPTGRGVYSGRHLPLLAYRQEAGRCERIETRGVWLGVVPEVEDLLADDALALAPGDWLFLYTDGLIECRDAEGRLFDLERLEAAIARACSVHAGAEAAGRHVLAEVTRFMAGRPADDDMSLVVLRRR